MLGKDQADKALLRMQVEMDSSELSMHEWLKIYDDILREVYLKYGILRIFNLCYGFICTCFVLLLSDLGNFGRFLFVIRNWHDLFCMCNYDSQFRLDHDCLTVKIIFS